MCARTCNACCLQEERNQLSQRNFASSLKDYIQPMKRSESSHSQGAVYLSKFLFSKINFPTAKKIKEAFSFNKNSSVNLHIFTY